MNTPTSTSRFVTARSSQSSSLAANRFDRLRKSGENAIAEFRDSGHDRCSSGPRSTFCHKSAGLTRQQSFHDLADGQFQR
jgi:hypothetical protein